MFYDQFFIGGIAFLRNHFSKSAFSKKPEEGMFAVVMNSRGH